MLVTAPLSLALDSLRSDHNVCHEHGDAVHQDLDYDVVEVAPDAGVELALKVTRGKNKDAAGHGHDHCQAIGNGLRPADTQKGCPKKVAPPAHRDDKPTPRPVPDAHAPIYATAPKQSPPRG